MQQSTAQQCGVRVPFEHWSLQECSAAPFVTAKIWFDHWPAGLCSDAVAGTRVDSTRLVSSELSPLWRPLGDRSLVARASIAARLALRSRIASPLHIPRATHVWTRGGVETTDWPNGTPRARLPLGLHAPYSYEWVAQLRAGGEQQKDNDKGSAVSCTMAHTPNTRCRDHLLV